MAALGLLTTVLIIPFIHPAMFAIGYCAAPLAAGSTLIVKPGDQTQISAVRIAELINDIFPAGVFNVITGNGMTADYLAKHFNGRLLISLINREMCFCLSFAIS